MPDQPEPAGRRYQRLVSDLSAAVFDGPGHVDRETRRSAETVGSLPEPWRSYVSKVRDGASGVTDSDIERLLASGHSEDEVFEMTVAAAVAASLRTLDAGLRSLRGPS